MSKIVKLPDPRLRLVSEPVAAIDDAVKALGEEMLEAMYAARGIGLAAIQIGVPKRVVTVDIGREIEGETELDEDGEEVPKYEADPMVLVNPEILWRSEETRVYEEGCLSIPDYTEEVERPARIRVRWQALDGSVVEREAEGLLATCIQHEVDHLDGKLFIDYLSRLKRDRVVKKFSKAARRESETA
ncbi:peptide deformylase [Salinarimonas ramus]|uniref:Peptide deformylase n=1 Tax=Salinarimonas ramus TaxID=690164 RepID=A0A917Q4J9_9HYPH|nr:peptide deformylase [Salinarimonas ramus]GGK22871.1 peptide deformylase [Salinarimonas ramus]